MFATCLLCDLKDLRRHRSEVSVELRKAKKDDQLSKRRNMDDESEPGSPLQDKNAQVCYNFFCTFFIKFKVLKNFYMSCCGFP